MIEIYVGENGYLTMGNGKTLSMVIDSYNLKQKGYTIMSNFKIDFVDKYYDIGELNDILEKYNKIVLLADELSVFSNAYSFNSSNSRGLMRFVTQLRKKEIILKATSQVFNTIPRFIRRLGVTINLVEKLHYDNKICLVEDNRICEQDFHKYRVTNVRSKNQKPRFLIPHLIKFDKISKSFKMYKDYFYNCYDSDQIIMSDG